MENIDARLLSHPPEKVRKMFEAVIAMAAEKADLNSITVQMITDRAGIGKGTAYSYFSSREELIVLSLFYDYGKLLQELERTLHKTKGFKAKMYQVLDWVYQHEESHMTLVHLLEISIGGPETLCGMRSGCLKEVFDGMQEYMKKEGDALMERGWQEGLFTETDPVKRRMAFATMILQLVMVLGEKNENSFFQMPYEEVREFAYKTMIHMLSM